MERQFTLPISFAVAAHAALLFGFSKSPRATPPSPEKPKREFVVVKAADEEPPPEVRSDSVSREPKAALKAPLPRIPEPLVVDPGIVTTVPPLQPFTDVDTRQILPPASVIGRTNGNRDWGDVLPTALLDQSPTTRFQPAPAYPLEAKTAGLRGEVVVEFVVDERGRVQSPRVVSSTHRIFDEATLRAVARWVFEPGRREGRVVRFRMSVPVLFNLNE